MENDKEGRFLGHSVVCKPVTYAKLKLEQYCN